MLRQRFLLALLAGCFLAICSSIASAQDYNNWTRHNHGAPPDVDKLGIPCPTGGCQQAINQVKKDQKHQPAPQAQPTEDERGWDGVGQDPDKIPFSKDTPDPDDADPEPSGDGSILGHRNIPK
jgi:hypothetical protein